jgi:hypothetical protein
VKHFEAGMAGYTYLEQPELAESLLNSVLPKENRSVRPAPEERPDEIQKTA